MIDGCVGGGEQSNKDRNVVSLSCANEAFVQSCNYLLKYVFVYPKYLSSLTEYVYCSRNMFRFCNMRFQDSGSFKNKPKE